MTVALLLLAFLFLTGLQSLRTSARLGLRTSARLAWFSNRLAVAILIAACFRVRAGWPAIFAAQDPAVNLWQGFSGLVFATGPLVFLASDLGFRLEGRKQVLFTSAIGVALPSFVVPLMITAIEIATEASGFRQASMSPNIAMALWGRAAASTMPARMMLVAITLFGAIRFGIMAMANSMDLLNDRVRWAALVVLIGLISWGSLLEDDMNGRMLLQFMGTILVVTAAIVTGDFVSRGNRVEQVARIDLAGAGAMVVGLGSAWFFAAWANRWGIENWCCPWLIPAYAVAFVACLGGRMISGENRRH